MGALRKVVFQKQLAIYVAIKGSIFTLLYEKKKIKM